ncbi:MAG: ABC transporter substrate-binding protein [Clostridiales bacterium]|nr:ABC transporter substrate-binding protein [Clostridiales bacterium]
MKKSTRLISLLLVVLLALGIFAACGNTDPEDTTSGDNTTGEATTTADTGDVTTDNPAKTYDGYQFTINSDKFFPRYTETGEFQSETDANLADELLALEEALDVEFVLSKIESDDLLATLTTATMGGQMLTDVIYAHQEVFMPAAKAGYLYAVDGSELTAAGLDYADSTRWYQPTVTEVNVFGHYWGLDVASEYVSARTGYFVSFNHELVKSAGVDNLYQLVRDKQWNWETYLDIAKKVTKDTDGDGNFDYFGTGATAWGNEAVCNGVNYIQPDETGKWVVSIDTPAGVDALQFLYDMNYGTNTRCDEGSGTCRQMFADGFIAFNWCNMGHIQSTNEIIRNSNHPYGIVPMPLGPAATEYVSSHDDLQLLIIQTSNKELDRTVDILNQWALVMNDTEAYLDVLDDGRCNTEEDKEMMVTYIIPNFYLTMMEITEDIHDCIDSGFISGVSYYQMTPAQVIETYSSQLQGHLDAFFNN